MASVARPLQTAVNQIELSIGGMTCASCSSRIEKKLNRMDGVTATVNYATEKASVTFPAEVTAEDLVATVVKTGYTAELPPPPRTAEEDDPAERAQPVDELRSVRTRLWVSVYVRERRRVHAIRRSVSHSHWWGVCVVP